MWKDLAYRLHLTKRDSTLSQFYRYILVGGTAALVDFSLFAFCIKIFHLHYLFAALVGYCIAFACNYYLTITFVFKSKRRMAQEITMILVITLLGLLWTQLLLYLFIAVLAVDALISRLIVLWIVLLWNFSMRKIFVF